MTGTLRVWASAALVGFGLAVAVGVVPDSSALGATVSEGSIDSTYGYDGRALDWTTTGTQAPSVGAATVLADGSIAVAAVNIVGAGGGVLRYRSDGSRDTSFGDGGRSSYTSGDPLVGAPSVIAVQPNGAIIVGGSDNEFTTDQQAMLVRYTASGHLDTSFGSGGQVLLPVTSAADSVRAISILGNGTIVIAGDADQSAFVAKLSPAGQLNTSFGSNGYAIAQVNGGSATNVTDMVVGTNGSILTVGPESSGGFSGIGMTKWTSVGQPDSSLGGNGQMADAYVDLAPPTHLFPSSVALQPDGKIVVAGTAQITNGDNDIAVWRFNSDGSRDATFAPTPYPSMFVTSSTTQDYVNDVTLQRDGKIVVAGRLDPGGNTADDDAVIRLSVGGAIDSSFNSSGTVLVDFDRRTDTADAVRVLRNGKIVVVGGSFDYNTGDANPSMVRLFGDRTPPVGPTFSALPMFSLAAKQRVRWSATDDNTGVKSYDVQRRTGSYTSSKLTGWKTIRSQTAAAYVDVKRAPGVMTCFRVRARDWAGNVGVYSFPHCTTFPVDDRKLSAHGTWSSLTGSAYYLGTARRSASAGSSLTISATFRQLAVVASTCPTCGKVKVYLGKSLLGTLNLHSTKSHNRVLEFLPATSTVRSGTLRIVQVTGGKRVTIDGFGLTLDSAA